MKLVIATATATLLGMAAVSPDIAFAQDAEPAAEDASAPALRGADDAAPASDSAPADSPAPAPQVPAAIVAPDGAPAAPATAVIAADPAIRLAEAKAAAMAAAATPGVMNDPLVANVADYALFQRDLAMIAEREIVEPEDLDAVMDTLTSYDSGTLADAFYSYAAFLGAQDTEFVDLVKEAAEYYGVDQLVQGMINEPEYVLGFPGARDAAALVLDVVREDVARMTTMSERFKQESYDLQNRGWSNVIAEDRVERLGSIVDAERLTTPSPEMLAVVAYGAPIASDDPAGAGALRRAAFWSAVDYRPEPASTVAPPVGQDSETIGVMMTLAALRTLNVSQSRPDLVDHLLNLPTAEACLDFSLLHLQQCVAAAHFKYEDAFCIAEHQLKDMGECLGETVLSNAPVTPVRLPATQVAVETPAAALPVDAAAAPTAAN